MSAEFIDIFFPLSSYLLRSRHADTFRSLFPPDLQRKCSRPVHHVIVGHFAIPVMWPALAPVVLVGVAIGLLGYFYVLAATQPKFVDRPPIPSWSLAFAFYAMMNASALGSHCLVPRSSSWQPLMVSMDIAGTASCAFSALYACVSDELSGSLRSGTAAEGGKGSRRKHVLNLLLGNGLLNISAFVGLGVPFMAELLYIGTSVVSAIWVGRYICQRAAVGRQRAWRLLTFTGAVLALSGIPLDATLCRRMGPHVNHVTLLFTGCHVIMLGLLLYALEELVVRYGDGATAAASSVGGGGDDGGGRLACRGTRKLAADGAMDAGAVSMIAAAGDGAAVRGGSPRRRK